ncbi:hypothetical protein Bca4012_020560 [Brassica carinata]
MGATKQFQDVLTVRSEVRFVVFFLLSNIREYLIEICVVFLQNMKPHENRKQLFEWLVNGLPARAEITDAANGRRSSCVMLNKGKHIVEAV